MTFSGLLVLLLFGSIILIKINNKMEQYAKNNDNYNMLMCVKNIII